MMRRRTFSICALAIALLTTAAIATAPSTRWITLPSGWRIAPPPGAMTETDTMPEGASLSPDRTRLAVLDSGFNPAALRIYSTATLEQSAEVRLPGGSGRPVWLDNDRLIVAGANADGLIVVTPSPRKVTIVPVAAHAFPVAVATCGTSFAVASDGDSSVRIGALDGFAMQHPIRIGGHISSVAFSGDCATLYAASSSYSRVAAIDVRTGGTRWFSTRLHPASVLPIGNLVYVAESDADTIGIYSTAGKRVATIGVGAFPRTSGIVGASPNSLTTDGSNIFATLGAGNAVAVIRGRALTGRIASGWYPTDAVPFGHRLLVINGKGEGSVANPYFKPQAKGYLDYIGSLEYGSIREYDLSRGLRSGGNPQGTWREAAAGSSARILHAGGPIRHVFFILKENRSYDQVLGDVREGNGDARLTWFGAKVTPNQHALGRRFGLYDNTYTSGEVSESGHFWADAAFATDYIERTWPMLYGDRDTVDDALEAAGTGVPRNGYIWQRAAQQRVSFRDYGETDGMPSPGPGNLGAKIDTATISDRKYVSWNLDYSDLNRVREWRREFRSFVQRGNVPQLEWIWLPNDHTFGSKVGKLTPVAYVAQNDYAVGQIVAEISHSKIWSSSAIFITEDDAQDGPDHVSDQRTTFFLVSPYSRPGVHSEHHATVDIVRTIELLLGLRPLSTYDALASPVSSGFTSMADLRPFDAIAPKVPVTTRNIASTPGARRSAYLDFTHPDAIAPRVLDEIIARNHAR